MVRCKTILRVWCKTLRVWCKTLRVRCKSIAYGVNRFWYWRIFCCEMAISLSDFYWKNPKINQKSRLPMWSVKRALFVWFKWNLIHWLTNLSVVMQKIKCKKIWVIRKMLLLCIFVWWWLIIGNDWRHVS